MKIFPIQNSCYIKNTHALNFWQCNPIKKSGNFILSDSSTLNQCDCLTFTSKNIENFENYKKTFNDVLNFDKSSGQNTITSVKKNFINDFSKKISENQSQPIIIGLTGESRSGKSHFGELLKNYTQENNLDITFISTDNYFKDISKLIKEKGSYKELIRSGYDQDSPNSLYLDDLEKDLKNLKKGKTVYGRKYHMDSSGISKKNKIKYQPKRIIFIEGTIAALKKYNNIVDARIYVDTPQEVRKERFMKDASTRGEDREAAQLHWDYVQEAGKKYVQPLKSNCEIIIDGEYQDSHINNIFDILYKCNSTRA